MSKKLFEHLGKRSSDIRPSDFVDLILSEAAQERDVMYDTHVEELRNRYNDRGLQYTQNELRSRYPETYEQQPAVNAGTVRQVAFKDARTYSGPAKRRWLDFKTDDEAVADAGDVDNDIVLNASNELDSSTDVGIEDFGEGRAFESTTLSPEQEERQRQFDLVVKESRYNAKVRECDRRRSIAGQFGRVDWDAMNKTADGSGRVRIELFWGSTVHVITHYKSRTSLDGALVIIASAHGPAGRRVDENGRPVAVGGRPEKFFEVWHRSFVEDPKTGDVAFGIYDDKGAWQEGQWRVELIGQSGFTQGLYEQGIFPHGHIMPWFYRGVGEPDGVLVTHPGDQLLSHARNQDVLQSDILKSVSDNSTPGILIFGAASLSDKKVVFRRGELTPILEAKARAQEFKSDITPVPLEIARDQSQRLAINRRMNRGAYDPGTGQAESGTARAIENRDEDTATLEMTEDWETFEMDVLLPLVVKVQDTWGDGAKIAYSADGTPLGDVEFKVDLNNAPNYETPAEKAARVDSMVTAGLMTRVDAVIELGRAADETEAQKYLEEIDEEKRSRGPDFGDDVFRRDLEGAINGTRRPALDDDDDDEGEGEDVTVTPKNKKGADMSTDEKVQDQALNGAQVASLVTVAESLASGILTGKAASAILSAAFPTMTPDEISAIVNNPGRAQGVTDA